MKLLVLPPFLFLSACVTVNIVESPLAGKQVVASPVKNTTMLSPLTAGLREKLKTGEFKDERDGQIYKTVTIGNQTWKAQNLNYKTEKGSLYYDNDAKKGIVYGMLYNYNVLNEACPKGWHIPSDAEWETLEYNAGMQAIDTAKNMFRGSIAPNFLIGGATKMDVFFAGVYGRSKFYEMGVTAYFWTSTRENNPITTRLFKSGDNRICKNKNGEGYCLSVRCVKND